MAPNIYKNPQTRLCPLSLLLLPVTPWKIRTTLNVPSRRAASLTDGHTLLLLRIQAATITTPARCSCPPVACSESSGASTKAKSREVLGPGLGRGVCVKVRAAPPLASCSSAQAQPWRFQNRQEARARPGELAEHKHTGFHSLPSDRRHVADKVFD